MPTPSHEVLRRIRSKLHFAAALAIKNNIDVSAEIIKIFGLQESAESKNIIERNRLSMRDRLVLEFKGNRDTRCSKSTITASVKILKALELIKYTVEDMKVGYSRT